MDKVTDVGEPTSELERLIAELSGSGLLAFVFGVGWWAAHLKGVTTPLFRGPADRRWWHVELGDDTASWTMDVRVDEIIGVRFVRGPYCCRPRCLHMIRQQSLLMKRQRSVSLNPKAGYS